MRRASRKRKWKLNEPWNVRRGQRIRIMIAGRTKTGGYRFAIGKVTRLLKGGFGVEVRLSNGRLTTRDTQDTWRQ